MRLKKPFKFILPGVLLAAGITAFAVDEVTLNDGKTTVSWTAFVNAINDPSTIVGPTQTAENNASIKEAADAKEAASGVLKLENDTLTTAKNILNEEGADGVQGKLAAAKSTLGTKKTTYKNDSTALQTYIKSLETAYNDSVASLTKRTNDLATQKTKKEGYDTDLNQANAALAKATADYTKASNSLNNLPKKPSTVGWLQTIYSAASLFDSDLNEGNEESTAKIYYCIQEYKAGFGTTMNKRLLLTFGDQPSNGKPTEGCVWNGLSPYDFYMFITGDSSSGHTVLGITPNQTAVYLGPDYKTTSGSANEFVTISFSTNAYTLSGNALAAIESLKNNALYQTTDYEDKKLAAQYQRDMRDAEAAMDDANDDIKTANENLSTIKTLIADIQAWIDTLNDTTIPNAKTKWQQAVDGTLEGDTEYTELKDAVDTAAGEVTDAQTEVDNAQKAVDDAKQAVEDAQADVTTADANFKAADQKLTEVTATAQAAANLSAREYYQDITLNADVVADAPITVTNFTGSINGNGKIINIDITEGNQTTLFKNFRGSLANAAINGTFAVSTASSVIDNVAVNTGSAWRFYDNEGKSTTASSLAEVGFMARALYGVNFESKQLVALDDDSRVYNITVYGSPTSSAQSYVQVSGTGFVSENGAVSVPVNMFAKSATSDIKSRAGLTNVYYQEGTNLVCQNVEIQERNNFYCPEDITAVNVTYNRSFNKRMNALCVPFEMSYAYSDKIDQLCTYDRETPEKFWFTVVDKKDVIPANTPILMYAELGEGESITLDLTDVDIKKTPANQIIRYEESVAGSGQSFGTFKSVASGQFGGQFAAGRIYGLNGTKFQLAGEGSSFPAFRMAIASDPSVAAAAQYAPRFIALQDEDGNVITEKYEESTTGIEGVESDMVSVNVAPGIGEIIINSDADFGQVEVYSLEGRVAARAYVTAGTTHVSVQRGLYIVLGQKVLVK